VSKGAGLVFRITGMLLRLHEELTRRSRSPLSRGQIDATRPMKKPQPVAKGWDSMNALRVYTQARALGGDWGSARHS